MIVAALNCRYTSLTQDKEYDKKASNLFWHRDSHSWVYWKRARFFFCNLKMFGLLLQRSTIFVNQFVWYPRLLYFKKSIPQHSILLLSLHRPVADLLYAPKDRLVHNTYSMYCTHLHTVTFWQNYVKLWQFAFHNGPKAFLKSHLKI